MAGMLSDARTIWDTASSAIKQINDNISNALDNIDIENLVEDGTNADIKSSSIGRERVETELKTYRTLLDEAQYQFFELSKQTSLIVAEKDAELSIYKSRLGEAASSNSEASVDVEISSKLEKLFFEKAALEASLNEMQGVFKEATKEKNELKVHFTIY